MCKTKKCNKLFKKKGLKKACKNNKCRGCDFCSSLSELNGDDDDEEELEDDDDA